MEPYQILGGAEECHSSESGWTMYIGSPIDDDGDDGDNDSRYNNGGTIHQADAEDESDDSMASDASSGPSHHGIIDASWGNGKGGYGFVDFQQVADDEEEYVDNKESFDKKAKHNKTQEKQIEGKKVEKKKEMVFNGSKGKAKSVQGVGKVRKSYWVEK